MIGNMGGREEYAAMKTMTAKQKQEQNRK